MATNTAASFTNHTGNGSAGPFNVSFSYLSEAEVDVTVGGVLKTITTHYTFTSATQITFTSGNEPGNGVAIKFQRDTAIGSKKVDFVDGSVLTETDLDNNADQLLFSMQEIVDSGIGSSVQSVTGTTPIVSSGGTSPAISISAATTSAAGSMSASDKSKLDGIEASATADQTASEIRTLVESASDSNVFTDADHTKLNAIEASATADQTASEIRTLVESATDSNVFTDADHTKLNAIEASATADQTGAEIKTAYEAESNTNAFTDAEKTKLNAIEASADVTDATNVNAAGAVMNSDLDVKGELLVGDGSGDPSALSVGTNGYVLKANSSTATGLEWAAESTGTDLTSGGTINGDLTLTGANYNAVWDKSDNALEFADQAKATFGDGGDLQIYHQTSGNHSIIKETGSGSLIIQAENFDVQDTSGNSILGGVHDSYVSLSHHGDTRLITSSTGITVYSGASGSEVATGAITSGNIGVTGNITVSGTVDSRDVATDGTKLDGIEASADVTDATNVDAAGAVMNSDLDGKGELLVGDGSGDPTALAAGTNGYVLKANSSTATGLEWSAAGSGGDVNQNAFSTIAVSGQSNVAADSATDTLNIAAGSNVTVTTNASSDTVTISSTDTNTTYSVGDGGLSQNNFTDALKTKLDGIAASANVGITDVVSDSSPQLGGNLDVQSSEITTSTSNGNIKLNPNGTGVVEVKGDGSSADGTIQLNCSQNSHGIKLKSPPHSAGASYTLTFPNTDGSANQVLKTDGSGGLDWVDQTTDTNTQLSNAEVRTAVEAASDSNVFTDADHTKLNAIEASATADQTASEIKTLLQSDKLTVNEIADDAVTADKLANSINTEITANTAKTSNATHTGEVTGSTALTIADNVVDEANLKVSNTPTNGYVLTAQSGNTGGLTWAAQSGGGGGLSSDAQNNTVGGSNAGDSFSGTDAVSNTLIGKNAGTAITTADKCVAIGHDAGSSNTTATGMTSIGFEAGKSYTVTGGTFIGYQAGKGLADGQQNTAIGEGAMANPTNSGSYANTYIGYGAAGLHGNGNQNTGIGLYVLQNNAAWSNIAIGNNAGGNNTSGTRGTFIGRYAGDQNTTGSYNFCAGYYAGGDVTTGSSNTFIGDQAGHTGTNNLTTGSNNTLIGTQAAASSATVSNEITLGDSNIASLRCNVQTISSLSDRRDKTDINTLDLGLDFVKSLNPVKFKWETRDGNGKDGLYEAGFIAQDFQQLQKDNDADYLKLVMDENPDRLEASYGKLIPVLVKAIQELTIEVETLKSNG
jgi:hypothetical protein